MTELESLSKAIHDHLAQRVTEIVAVEAKAAAKRTEERILEEASQISVKVLKRCMLEQFGQNLIISVNFKNTTT